MGKKDATPGTLPDKWFKVIQGMPEFKDTADAGSVDDLKKIIVDCEGNLWTIAKEKEADVKLNGAKELVKDLGGAYRDGQKAQNAKIQYALFLLESKGVDLDGVEKD